MKLKHKDSKEVTKRITRIMLTNLQRQENQTKTLSPEHNRQSSKLGTQERMKNLKIKVSQNQLVTSVSDAESYEDSKNHS